MNMYDYYASKTIRPTYANFADDGDLLSYMTTRKNMFHRLSLSPMIFDGKSVLEFGPDTGENALVFAKWGARMTLVEPCSDAHQYIEHYFAKFVMTNSIDALAATSLLSFKSDKKFDIINAEGFIYTIQPRSEWIQKTNELLVNDGLLIVSYLELYGSFFELLLKAVYSQVVRTSEYPSCVETAKLLFLTKWNTVQHTRKIESWFMDVIENPFVRYQYLIDAEALLTDMTQAGFRLYSAWPNYRDILDVRWIKDKINSEDELRQTVAFIKQNRLSHLFGKKTFFPGISSILDNNLRSLIKITDELIDIWSWDYCSSALNCINNIADELKENIYFIGDNIVKDLTEICDMLTTLFTIMRSDRLELLVDFCNTDRIFLSTWGTPAHYAVFEKIFNSGLNHPSAQK